MEPVRIFQSMAAVILMTGALLLGQLTPAALPGDVAAVHAASDFSSSPTGARPRAGRAVGSAVFIQAERGDPSFVPAAFAKPDFVLQRAIPQSSIAWRMAENQILERARSAPADRNEMLDAPGFRRVRRSFEVELLPAQPAMVAVAGAQAIDFAQIFGR
jgi:hypothetical protein